MMRESIDDNKKLHIVYLSALLAVILPLFIVGLFDRPSADDWSFSELVYQSLCNGGSIFDVLKASGKTIHNYYYQWEGRYSIVLLGSLMPGVWGEKAYFITPYIIIFSLILSQIYLAAVLLGKKNSSVILPIMIPAIIMEILYSPSIQESFFWYNGSINYSFMNSCSIVFVATLILIRQSDFSRRRKIILLGIMGFWAVLIGGTNFATSVSTIITILLLIFFFSIIDKKPFIFGLILDLIIIAGLTVSIMSPAINVRLNSNFGGQTGNAINAICMSVSKTMENIWLWSTSWQFVLVIVMIIPFVAKAVRNMDWSFKCPLLFTILSLGVYSSQIVATMYVDGTVGGGRQIAILLYSYWIWTILNLIYWIGWIYRKTGFRIRNSKINKPARSIYDNPGKAALVIAFLCFAGMCVTGKIKSVTTTRAVKDLITGSARGYAMEWDDRYEVLHDDSQKDVVFRRLENRPETILYADFEYEEPYTWVNEACASYYGKDSITVSLD